MSGTEQTPLLQDATEERLRDDNDGDDSPDEYTKQEQLPWRTRPSIHRVLPVFALVQIAAYMINTVKMNWVITLVCRELTGREVYDSDPVCQRDSVQSQVSQYTAWCSLVGGVLGLYMLPRISELSDRIGRKFGYAVFLVGDMLAVGSMMVVLWQWQWVNYRWIMVTYAITGIFGTAVLINVMMSSYTADCVRPSNRAKAMGYVTACTLVGKASGPFLSSTLVKLTGTLQATLGGALILDALAGVVLIVLVPETVTADAQSKAEATRRERGSRSWFREFNIFDPLASIWSIARNQDARACKNIMLLVGIDLLYELIIAGRAGIAVLYPQMRFSWTSVEIGYLQSATACARIVLLVVIIPQILALLKTYYREADTHSNGLSRTELFVLRLGNSLEVVGYSGYGLAWVSGQYIASSFIATSGVIAKPTVQSALLNLVPKRQVGEFLGAKGVLDGLTSIAFSSLGLSFYSFTVSRWPELIFYLSAAGYFIVILVTLFIKPSTAL